MEAGSESVSETELVETVVATGIGTGPEEVFRASTDSFEVNSFDNRSMKHAKNEQRWGLKPTFTANKNEIRLF